MISIERTKELIGRPDISDSEAEQIRDSMRSLVEIIFEQWAEESKRKNENEERKKDITTQED